MLFYLIRQQPWAGLARGLQGGHFDHADRLFHSVADTWSAAQTGTSDVKELLPEFFYQPEFLRNANGFDLGTRQVSTEALITLIIQCCALFMLCKLWWNGHGRVPAKYRVYCGGEPVSTLLRGKSFCG